MHKLICIVACTLLLSAAEASAALRGPISGVVETSDKRALNDVVVSLRCSAYGINSVRTSEVETRFVNTGEKFRVAWAWAGLAPAPGGCVVQVHHPLYATATVRVPDEFSVDLGVTELVPYLDVANNKPDSAATSRSQPWPFPLLLRHLDHSYNDFALAHPSKNRKMLAKYAEPLEELFERSVALLPTSLHDDNPSITKLRERLMDYQRVTGWQIPADRIELSSLAQAGDIGGVRALLDAGADPNTWNADGNSPLHIAALANNVELIEVLLDAGADIDRPRWSSGDSPLLEAVQYHREAATLLLLERGADPTYAAWRGPALLSAVSQNARTPIVEALIAHGAIENARESDDLVRILFAAARDKGKGATIRRLVGAGIPVDLRHDNGQTALMLAAWMGRIESVRTLIDLGADVSAKDLAGATAVEKARARGHDNIVDLLLVAQG